MSYITDLPANLKAKPLEIVEIKLWEVYLIMNRNNLYKVLIESSIDHGCVEKDQQEPGRITFRFYTQDWENSIRHLLYQHRIPVIVTSSHLEAVKTKGKIEIFE